MKKRSIPFACLVMMMILVLVAAACSGSGNTNNESAAPASSQASATSTPAAETPAPVAEEPIVISVKSQNDAPQDPNSPVTKAIEEQLNIKLDYVYLDREKETELLNLRISSGDIPDVMFLGTSQLATYSEQGVLAELSEEQIKTVAPTYYELITKSGGDNIFEFYKTDGKLYGLPLVSFDDVNFVPIWRDDWLKNVGIDKIPETLAEAEEAFYKFVNDDPDGNGKKDTYALSDRGMDAIFGAFGAHARNNMYWSEVDGGVALSSVLPEMKEPLALLSKWYKDGLIDPEFITGENKGQYWGNTVTFWNGKIGFSAPGTYYHVNPKFDPNNPDDAGSPHYQNFKELQGEAATYAAGLPLIGPTGKQGIKKWSAKGGLGIGIGKDVAADPRKMEKILEIVEKINSDEQLFKLIWFGVEGVTYDLKDGVPVFKAEYQDFLVRAPLAAGGNGLGFIFDNIDFYSRYLLPPALKDYSEKYARATACCENVVWSALPSDGEYKALLDTKIQEYYVQFITGQKSLDQWDEFIGELNKLGLQEFTAEANEWYKKYYK